MTTTKTPEAEATPTAEATPKAVAADAPQKWGHRSFAISDLHSDPEFQMRTVETDRTALRASLEAHGIQDPPHVWWDKGTEKWIILTGHGRIEEWKALGNKSVTAQPHEFKSRDEATEFALASNLDRNELALGDACRAHAARKALYDKQHPPKAGRPAKSSIPWIIYEDRYAKPGEGRSRLHDLCYIGKHADADMIEALNKGELGLGEAYEAVRSSITDKAQIKHKRKKGIASKVAEKLAAKVPAKVSKELAKAERDAEKLSASVHEFAMAAVKIRLWTPERAEAARNYLVQARTEIDEALKMIPKPKGHPAQADGHAQPAHH